MKDFISIPREALDALLKAAGSPLTPEEYLASLPATGDYKKYRSRARAAVWSKYILLIATVVSVLWGIADFVTTPIFDSLPAKIEDVIVAVGLVTVTFFEFRVHRYFRELNPAAPNLGFRNQSYFAVAILIYGLYHAWASFHMQIPVEYNNMLDADTMEQIRLATRLSYLVIGIVGCVSQFGLAWYYRSARVPTQT